MEPPRPDGAAIAAALRRPAFPIFGLPHAWPGRRFVAGWDEVAGLVTRLELGHLDEQEDALLVVHISPRPEPDRVPAEAARHSLHVEAVQWAEARGLPPPGASTEGRTRVMFDGHPVTFEYLKEGPLWLMRGRHGSIGLVLRGSNLDLGRVELVHLSDAAEYLVGFTP